MPIAQGDSRYVCRDGACQEPAFPSRDRQNSHEDLFHPAAQRRYGCRPCEAGNQGQAAASKSGFFSPKHLESHRRYHHSELPPEDCLIDRHGGAAVPSPPAELPPYMAAMEATAADQAAEPAAITTSDRENHIKGLQALFEDHQALAEANERQAATIAGLRAEITELREDVKQFSKAHDSALRELLDAESRLRWCAQTFRDGANIHMLAARVANGDVPMPEPAGQ